MAQEVQNIESITENILKLGIPKEQVAKLQETTAAQFLPFVQGVYAGQIGKYSFQAVPAFRGPKGYEPAKAMKALVGLANDVYTVPGARAIVEATGFRRDEFRRSLQLD